jgi:S-formylglutathione hydrolase
METVSSTATFGGEIRRLKHRSEACSCDMVFGVFLPPQARNGPVPALLWLSGLTCTDENFTIKSGAQRIAAELGIALVCPDTSPRGTDFPGEHDDFDFGSGAGFYVNATQSPWSANYRMYDYVTAELPALVEAELPINGKWGISGHSMGGHGALTCYLKNPGKYLSVSAFAPICNPSRCSWGQKAFSNYLGEDRNVWAEHDASHLIGDAQEKLPLLIDQGTADEWLTEQLMPGALEQAAIASHYPLTLRMQEGYDHGYYFVATFIENHLRHHARALL